MARDPNTSGKSVPIQESTRRGNESNLKPYTPAKSDTPASGTPGNSYGSGGAASTEKGGFSR